MAKIEFNNSCASLLMNGKPAEGADVFQICTSSLMSEKRIREDTMTEFGITYEQ